MFHAESELLVGKSAIECTAIHILFYWCRSIEHSIMKIAIRFKYLKNISQTTSINIINQSKTLSFVPVCMWPLTVLRHEAGPEPGADIPGLLQAHRLHQRQA